MPYKLGEEEAIFCGHSLSQERVSLSLARPTFQAVSPSIALLPWYSRGYCRIRVSLALLQRNFPAGYHHALYLSENSH